MCRGHNGKVRSLWWSADDTALVTAGVDGAIYEWRVLEGRRVRDFVQKGWAYNCAVGGWLGRPGVGGKGVCVEGVLKWVLQGQLSAAMRLGLSYDVWAEFKCRCGAVGLLLAAGPYFPAGRALPSHVIKPCPPAHKPLLHANRPCDPTQTCCPFPAAATGGHAWQHLQPLRPRQRRPILHPGGGGRPQTACAGGHKRWGAVSSSGGGRGGRADARGCAAGRWVAGSLETAGSTKQDGGRLVPARQ